MTKTRAQLPSTRTLKPVLAGHCIADEITSVTANDATARKQWTLKGIPPQAVDQTREAARRSGMKLNSWVTQALLTAIHEADSMPTPMSPRSPAELESRIEELEAYIKESMADLQRRSEEVENSLKAINAVLIKMYADR